MQKRTASKPTVSVPACKLPAVLVASSCRLQAAAGCSTHLHDQPLLLGHRRPHSVQLPVQPPPNLQGKICTGAN